MKLKKYSWDDIHALNIRNSTLLIDIDGVLMADGEDTIAPDAATHINHLHQSNDIFIVSNTIYKKRCDYIAQTTNAICVHSHHKKPSTKILNDIPNRDPNKPMIVIGDKIITDGLLQKELAPALL